jgi:hypothetical protein
LQHARRLLAQAVQLDDEALTAWLGQTLTSYRQWSPEDECDDELDLEPPLQVRPGTRLAWSDSGLLFVNGQQWSCPAEFARQLCRTGRIDALPEDEEARAVLEQLIEQNELLRPSS